MLARKTLTLQTIVDLLDEARADALEFRIDRQTRALHLAIDTPTGRASIGVSLFHIAYAGDRSTFTQIAIEDLRKLATAPAASETSHRDT